MSEVRIAAAPRTEFGKGAARRVRRANQVPAVVYGHGTDPVHISLPGHDLMIALKQGANVLLRLEGLDGGAELALPRDVQRDPVRGFLEHVDLVIVKLGEKVAVDVAVVTVGEVTSDGLLNVESQTISVEAEATNIPTQFEISVEGLPVGATVHAKDVSLPAGVTLLGDPEAAVLHVLGAMTEAQVDAELAASDAELGAGPSGAAEQAEAQEQAEGAAAGGATGEGDAVPTGQPGGPDQSDTTRG